MPRFCSACGEPLRARAPVACPGCGAEHWANASPAGAALVVHEGRLLLTRRAIEPWRGHWCAPSGFCDGPEHPAAAAVRETLEETGIPVRVVGYLGHWIDEYRPGDGDGLDPEYCAVSYYHAVPTGAVVASCDAKEVGEVRWFGPHELPAEIAPRGNGARIFAAWLEALRRGGLVSPLPDA